MLSEHWPGLRAPILERPGAGLNLSPDVLKGIARIIAPSSKTDPLAYTTSVDGGLRSLLGFGSPLAVG